jgi:hypothetical protein
MWRKQVEEYNYDLKEIQGLIVPHYAQKYKNNANSRLD